MGCLDELRAILPSERVFADPVTKLAYECDGFPMHRHPPLAIVLPETSVEVVEIVKTCRRFDVAFQARGAGTGLSGGASPTEQPTVLIGLAGMKRIIAIDPIDRRARVQPGVVNAELSRAAAPHGLYYAPDPSSQIACTLGGNIAENSGGPHCFKYGMTTDHILAATLVTAEGEVLRLHEGEGPDLLGVLTGSEGTFGVVTELDVRLLPTPEATRTWLASYRDMSAACRAVSTIVRRGIVPAALEILDSLTIRAVEASIYAAGYSREAAAVLLVELDGTRVSIDADVAQIEAILDAEDPIEVESTEDAEQRLRLWKGRKGAFGAMGRLAPDLYVLDGVVPRSQLELVLERIVEIGERFELKLSNVFHAGDGNLHPNLSYDGRDPVERAKVLEAGTEILRLCVDVGGSITGEHGVGSEKLEHMSFMFDEVDIGVMHEVKACFDPEARCNPHKAIPSGGSCKEGASALRPEALALEAES